MLALGVSRDETRETIGVSLARPADAGNAPADEKQQALLDWKARQVCTNGYDRLQEDIEPAEDNLQIVDWQLRNCGSTISSAGSEGKSSRACSRTRHGRTLFGWPSGSAPRSNPLRTVWESTPFVQPSAWVSRYQTTPQLMLTSF